MSFPDKIFSDSQHSGSNFRALEGKKEMEVGAVGIISMEMHCERSLRPMCFVCASWVTVSMVKREASEYIIKMIGGKISYWSSDSSVKCYENYRWIPLYKNTFQMSLPSTVFPPTMCLFSSHPSLENVREILLQTVCLSNKYFFPWRQNHNELLLQRVRRIRKPLEGYRSDRFASIFG